MAQPPFENLRPADGMAVVWAAGSWRCELWGTAEAGWLVLFSGDQEALRRPIRGSIDLQETAETWRQRVAGDGAELGLAEPSRRRADDRRRLGERGGRRADDPSTPKDDATG
jgi:hypothetical protein